MLDRRTKDPDHGVRALVLQERDVVIAKEPLPIDVDESEREQARDMREGALRQGEGILREGPALAEGEPRDEDGPVPLGDLEGALREVLGLENVITPEIHQSLVGLPETANVAVRASLPSTTKPVVPMLFRISVY